MRWESGLVVVVIVIAIMGSALSPEFLTANNFFNLGLNTGEIAIMALPMALIIISGEIDLSVESTLGMSSALLGVLWADHWPMLAIFAVVAVVGVLAGAVNGLLVTRVGLPSLAVTIGTLALYRGIALILLGPRTVANFPAFYTIPKNLGNPYFTTADSKGTGGALAAISAAGDTGTETSGTAATSASQIPAIQAAITKGANALIVSATDPTALCPTLNGAMKRKITVVTYDSDAPTCRSLFINQASTPAIGTSEVDLLAKEIGDSGEIGIVSAAASATNQNAWIGYMKQELTKYPKMKLVATVYGNDDPATATQVTQGLLEQYPNIKGIISPTTVGILAAAGVLDTAKYRGKVQLTGLGTPDSMKKYVSDGTVKAFELWNPANLGYLAGYAAADIAGGSLKVAQGATFKAGKLGTFTIGADNTVLLGPPTVFTSANINNFNF